MHPELGTSIRASNGETPTDFVTAMYAGGTSMGIVGASDFTPHTSPTRLLFLFNLLIGMSVMSLTLTYLMQVYTALRRRNVLAMNLHFPLGVHRRCRRIAGTSRTSGAVQWRLREPVGTRCRDDPGQGGTPVLPGAVLFPLP
jgi:hypothetical protein